MKTKISLFFCEMSLKAPCHQWDENVYSSVLLQHIAVCAITDFNHCPARKQTPSPPAPSQTEAEITTSPALTPDKHRPYGVSSTKMTRWNGLSSNLVVPEVRMELTQDLSFFLGLQLLSPSRWMRNEQESVDRRNNSRDAAVEKSRALRLWRGL